MLRITGTPNLITANSDYLSTVTLWENGLTVDFSSGTVQCALQDSFSRVLVAATAQSSNSTGASWSAGVLAVVFTASQLSAMLNHDDAWLEIQVKIAGLKKTWPLLRLPCQSYVIP